jgi:hypothetical protein
MNGASPQPAVPTAVVRPVVGAVTQTGVEAGTQTGVEAAAAQTEAAALAGKRLAGAWVPRLAFRSRCGVQF